MRNIREIKTKDAPEIAGLNKELGYDYPAERVAPNIEEILQNTPDKIFVAVDDSDKAIAYIHLAPYRGIYFDSMANVVGLVVASEYQSNGVGKALLDHGENWAKQNGFSRMRIISSDHRLRAHEFYLNNGYQHLKTQKNFGKTL